LPGSPAPGTMRGCPSLSVPKDPKTSCRLPLRREYRTPGCRVRLRDNVRRGPSGGLAGRLSNPPSQRYRIDSDTPNVVALTAVAAGVRFSDLAMRTTPDFAFAIVFSVRTSSFVHARRRAVVFLRANTNLRCLVWRSGLLSTKWRNSKWILRHQSDCPIMI